MNFKKFPYLVNLINFVTECCFGWFLLGLVQMNVVANFHRIGVGVIVRAATAQKMILDNESSCKYPLYDSHRIT